MAYLLLLTLLCLSLLLVMSSEGLHSTRQNANPVMRQNSGQKQCVIIRPHGEDEEAQQTITFIYPDTWHIKRVSCEPTTKEKGLSEDCYSKIRKGIDLLVFDVFDLNELREIQHNLAIAEPPRIDFFVRYNAVFNPKNGTTSRKVELLDIEKIIIYGYSKFYVGKFVEFSPEDGKKVSYYGNINWKIKVETDLKYKERKDDTKYKTLHSFVGKISKDLSGLRLTDPRRKGKRKSPYIYIQDLQIPENTEGIFKPMKDKTIPLNFEHNFSKTKKKLQITVKQNNVWLAGE